MYCEKCSISFETKYCPACGNKSVRMTLSDDMCFLTEKELLWSDMLEDILKQNNTPVFTKKDVGNRNGFESWSHV